MEANLRAVESSLRRCGADVISLPHLGSIVKWPSYSALYQSSQGLRSGSAVPWAFYVGKSTSLALNIDSRPQTIDTLLISYYSSAEGRIDVENFQFFEM